MILPNGNDDLVLRTDESRQPIPTRDEDLTMQSLRRWARAEHKRGRGINSYTLSQAAITLERVTNERDRLQELLSYATEWVRDLGYDDPDTAPGWFLSALQEAGDE